MFMGAGKPFQMFEYPLPTPINIMVTRGDGNIGRKRGVLLARWKGRKQKNEATR